MPSVITLMAVSGLVRSVNRTAKPTAPPTSTPSSSATRSATARAASRRGWVWPMTPLPAVPRPSSTHSFGSWVLLPDPVSPATTTTWCSRIVSSSSWRRSTIGSSGGYLTSITVGQDAMVDVSDRVLNRTTLARQGLLARSADDAEALVTRLVGLQAQEPQDPYVALWSRIDRFDPAAVTDGLSARRLVRIVVLRGTIHLVTADDALGLRPLMQPVLDAELSRHPDAKGVLDGVDLTEPLAFVHSLTSATPSSGTALRAAVAERFPDLPPAALSIAARCKLPMVQVPPRGLWRTGGQVKTTPLDTWVGRPLEAFSIDDVVLRYLAAFGPATVADVSTWCRLTAMRDVVDRVVAAGRAVRLDRNLVDIAGGVLASGDEPAPVRFLPQYDNCLLAHADRTRFVGGHDAGSLYAMGELGRGSILVDGLLRASWKVVDGTITVLHHRLAKRTLTSIEAEGRRLARFLGVDGGVTLTQS
jgi:hypothetical protein